MKYLYHITSKENAKRILSKHQIKISNGDNSKLAADETSAVYLCEYKDIPYWRQLLCNHTVLQIPIKDIDMSEDNMHEQIYSLYKEYISRKNITSDHMKIIYAGKPTHETNLKLCEMYLYNINALCTLFMRYYNNNPASDDLKEITTDVAYYLEILNRMDYMDITKSEWKTIKDNLIDSCCCALSDYYNNTENRLWQQLVEFPEDESYEIRKELHDFIKTNLKPVLYAKTGGWNF